MRVDLLDLDYNIIATTSIKHNKIVFKAESRLIRLINKFKNLFK